jgi:hypothetical protein
LAGSPNNETGTVAFDAIETNDGSLILVGETASSNFPKIDHKGGVDLVVLKVN